MMTINRKLSPLFNQPLYVQNWRNSGFSALLFAAMIFGSAILPSSVAQAKMVDNPYPTVAIADYVFGCMSSNGQTREALMNCSCSIDVIASIIPYEAYQRAETVLSLRLLGGEKSAIFKTSARWKEAVGNLRRAQAEAEVRCF